VSTDSIGADVILCAGLNRFGKPCTNRVSDPRRFCGRCAGSRNEPAPPPPPRNQRRVSTVELLDELGVPPSEWTVAHELIARLTPIAGGDTDLLALVDIGARLAAHSRSPNTQAAYAQHWRTFCAFCDRYGLSADLPVEAEVVSYFIAYLAAAGRTDRSTGERSGEPLSHGYLRQALGAIGHRHTIAGLPSPTVEPIVRGLLDGYAKLHGTDVEAKTPLRADDLRRVAETLSQPNSTSTRDLAICLLATHPGLDLGASALAGLDGGHVQLPNGFNEPMVLLVGRAGTKALRAVEVAAEADSAICPVGAMRALAPDHFGPVFRSAPDRRLTRQGIVWVVDAAVSAARLGPVATVNGFPKLAHTDRSRLAAQLSQPAPLDIRDRAIITNLYWGCFRGSELAAMRWRQVTVVDAGIEWAVPKAKNDRLGAGNTVGVPRHPNPWLCPVLALEDWRNTYEALTGRPPRPNDPVFPTLDRRTRLTGAMHRDAINDVVQRAATRAGLLGDYGSHSPRAGFTTDCIDADIPREHIQHHGRWRNIRSLDPYIRKTSTWGRTNPALRRVQQDD
jgi:site-specific recombinase XerC